VPQRHVPFDASGCLKLAVCGALFCYWLLSVSASGVADRFTPIQCSSKKLKYIHLNFFVSFCKTCVAMKFVDDDDDDDDDSPHNMIAQANENRNK